MILKIIKITVMMVYLLSLSALLLLSSSSIEVVSAQEIVQQNSAYETAIELSKQGNIIDAYPMFEKAAKEEPNNPNVFQCLSNLAIIYGDVDKCVEYQRISKKLDPAALPPLGLLHQSGNKCSGMSDIYWVSSFVKRSLSDSDKDPEKQYSAHISLGTQLEDSGLANLAMLHFDKAALLRPNDNDLTVRNAIMVPVVYNSKSAVIESRERLMKSVSNLLLNANNTLLDGLSQLSMPGTFYIVYQGFNDAKIMKDIQSSYEIMYPQLVYYGENEKIVNYIDNNNNNNNNDLSEKRKKIKIGFVSHYFRQHSVCKLFCGMIRNLNRDIFDVYIFSSTDKKDHFTKYVSEEAKFIDLKTGFLLVNRNKVEKENLDILVYTDIGMNTQTLMWAMARLAPIQMITWGHPATTGLKQMDYFISSDLFESDNGYNKYSEQMIRFDSLTYFFREEEIIKPSMKISSKEFKTKYNIDDNIQIILCPQTLPKFHPNFDDSLRHILLNNSINNARLVVVYDHDKPYWKDKLKKRLFDIEDKIIFIPSIPPEEFGKLIQLSTILLDPYPFGGGVTSLEAFTHCKTIVTLPEGYQNVPYLTAGMYHKMKITNLIANSSQEYIEIATNLLQDDEFRKNQEDIICERKSILYSQHEVVSEWESVFQRVHTVK